MILLPLFFLTVVVLGYVGGPRERHPSGLPTPKTAPRLRWIVIIVILTVGLLVVLIFLVRSRALQIKPLPVIQANLVGLFVCLTILALWFTAYLRRSFMETWHTLLNEYMNPTSWPDIDTEVQPAWRWTIKWWFIEHLEPLDAITIKMMRANPTLRYFESKVLADEYPEEYISYLDQRYWGIFSATVRDMIKVHLVQRVFRSTFLSQIGKSPESAYQDLRKGLLCPACSGRGKIGNRKCQDCNGSGFMQAKCTKCFGTGYIDSNELCPKCQQRQYPRKNCRTCQGTGIVKQTCPSCNGRGQVAHPHPSLFMKRLQYYWVLRHIDLVEEVRKIAWGRWVTASVFIGTILIFGVTYFYSITRIVPFTSLDFIIRILFAGCAILCVYTCTSVALAILLIFQGTNTLDLLYPVRDPVLGDPLWMMLAHLGGICATFSFGIYSFGMSLLVYGDDFIAGRITMATVIVIGVTFVFSALLLVIVLYKIHLLMIDAKDSRLMEIEYSLHSLQARAQREEILRQYDEIRKLRTWPVTIRLGSEVLMGFLLPTAIQVGLTLLQSRPTP